MCISELNSLLNLKWPEHLKVSFVMLHIPNNEHGHYLNLTFLNFISPLTPGLEFHCFGRGIHTHTTNTKAGKENLFLPYFFSPISNSP